MREERERSDKNLRSVYSVYFCAFKVTKTVGLVLFFIILHWLESGLIFRNEK